MFDRTTFFHVCVLLCGIAACGPGPATMPDGAPAGDGGVVADGGVVSDGANLGSRCMVTGDELRCSYETTSFPAPSTKRTVRYQVPLGSPPAGGWPVVFFFQGAVVPAENVFRATPGATAGQYHITQTIKALLDGGYAVIVPDALNNFAWQTNLPPHSSNWEGSSDHALMTAMFVAIGNGTLGTLAANRLYATGISSGGYMTSRMAVSYPGKFRGLAVHSASYATCGPTCTVPDVLPADHPPTLFVHGGNDKVVSIDQMMDYRNRLVAAGCTASSEIDPAGGHEWLPGAVTAIRAWFDSHP
jgi:poly(3-hydroxyoctanoate) depolymerase